MLTLISQHSRQIRPPIYSLKQTRLRKRRVIRYAILYFTLLVIFILLIAGPLVGHRFIKKTPQFSGQLQDLLQPTGLNNNDTSNKATGKSLIGGAIATGGGAAATGNNKRMFVEY